MTTAAPVTRLCLDRVLPPLVPYFAVGIGLLVFHSAWAAMLGYHALAVALVLASGKRIPLRELLAGRGVWFLLGGVILGAGGGVLLYILWPFLLAPGDILAHLEKLGLTRESWPWFVAYMSTVGAVVEEYYWRGCYGSNANRPVLNDFLFAGYHLLVLGGLIKAPWLAVVFVTLASGAWFWRQINRVNGGLLAPAVSHIAADVSVMLAVTFLVIQPL